MIYVIATIDLKKGCREKFVEKHLHNVPKVKAEKGCINYEPTIDIDSGLSAQGELRDDIVTVVESWESVEALKDHFKAPHMLSFREATKDLVNQVSIQVLMPAKDA